MTTVFKKQPAIVANKNVDNTFVRPEIIFQSKQQLQAYIVDAVSKNKRKSFNLKVNLT